MSPMTRVSWEQKGQDMVSILMHCCRHWVQKVWPQLRTRGIRLAAMPYSRVQMMHSRKIPLGTCRRRRGRKEGSGNGRGRGGGGREGGEGEGEEGWERGMRERRRQKVTHGDSKYTEANKHTKGTL